MPYIKPKDVISPKSSVSNLRPVYDHGKWSVTLLDWEQEPAVGIRWNGEEGSPGNPQSRGLPTWFVMPEPLTIPLLKTLLSKGLVGGADIEKETAKQAIQRFVDLHGGEEEPYVDASFEKKVREVIEKLIAEGTLAARAA